MVLSRKIKRKYTRNRSKNRNKNTRKRHRYSNKSMKNRKHRKHRKHRKQNRSFKYDTLKGGGDEADKENLSLLKKTESAALKEEISQQKYYQRQKLNFFSFAT